MNSQTPVADAEIRHVVSQVTLICMSAEFRRLHAELLAAYIKSGEPDPETMAFHDALFSIMAESISESASQWPGPGGG